MAIEEIHSYNKVFNYIPRRYQIMQVNRTVQLLSLVLNEFRLLNYTNQLNRIPVRIKKHLNHNVLNE